MILNISSISITEEERGFFRHILGINKRIMSSRITKEVLERLERSEMKISRYVLRGAAPSNGSCLLYYSSQVIYSDDLELNDMVIHHFFVARSIKLLKDDGILAFVVPSYVLDNYKNHPRHIMYKYGSLIASFRLPDNMFDSAKVTVDILFFIKNKKHYNNFLKIKVTYE